MNVSKLAPYAKAVMAVLGALLVTATAVADGTITNDEMVILIASWGAVFGVYQVPNHSYREKTS